MAISSRFSVAVHILSLLEMSKGTRITSDYIAGSVNTNPVVIRRLMSMLGRAGLVITTPGVAGAALARPPEQITLLDIYRAVQAEEAEGLFTLHEKPNPDCTVGRSIQSTLDASFSRAQAAMERELASMSLAEIIRDLTCEEPT
ncbi:Rrf2 family transcriptional regulator [Paenibacillus mucilaginosus]|uniref:BadM/Rrf2 family transcriptional regulator n=3 Tax=Paenibacillus mucilaginosus TaxID=61624 RepID=H6NLT1_9BACL|nr:Rrf2 family transcriptional regulator [Paenibacillus mucilaginosus]AEI44069.1 BadM/Rrf2 family transcriptional regulator [Paenibacillus mucilaginosus KNP414]AFC31646.1 BadM/Rrf2 family transcriptional regulator [Paenibacillus mucilaginosus 3016]AFH63991.1 Rrf2 family transcriptional regulator [Paenibacillus mucilaginosus K02]MCG7212446.1 Rrf2 family transcriptional regulator [Paenibacillus mucilaginosus]WDM25515.1 Rrf2 family transcriptional regulator [Paenibacillus mucilaginosus]